jgi:hypothetical protein
VLVRPLPFREPNRLAQVAEKNDKLNLPTCASSILNFLDWQEQSESFDEMAAVGSCNYTLAGTSDPERSFPRSNRKAERLSPPPVGEVTRVDRLAIELVNPRPGLWY